MKLPEVNEYPTHVLINQEHYSVRFVKVIRKEKTCLGICDPERREIMIKIGQTKEETFKTFLHELLHAIEFEYELKIKHKLVHALEDPIFKLLVENF